MILTDQKKAAPYYKKRREKLKQSIAQEGLDALLVTDLVNIRYLTGFTGTSATVVVTPAKDFFLTDFRYATQAKDQVGDIPVIEYRLSDDAILKLFGAEKIKKAGFEAERLTLAEFKRKDNFLRQTELVALSDMVEKIRLIKDESEIEAIRKLVAMQEKVYPKTLEMMTPGAVERDIAVDTEHLLKKEGADGAAFDFIVASGKRSAMPHGVASEKKIEKGELVTLDWGAKGFGYHTDCTRTVGVGKVDDELKKIYEITLEANLAAIDIVSPGVDVFDIDATARKVIEKAGYGKAFGHGTGHGVGMEIHEKPSVSQKEKRTVEEGMVFTIEPGIYLPGKGGVRVEDMLVVTEDGSEVLTSAIPKEFVTL